MKRLHLAEVFENPAISAGKSLASRPAGSRLLAAAKERKAVVVVAKLDRLFRSVADAANVIADKGCSITRAALDHRPDDERLHVSDRERPGVGHRFASPVPMPSGNRR